VPSIGINKSIFTPVGKGGDDNALPDSSFINISYNFMTPVDPDNTRYFWFQHRNGDPDNEALSAQMFEAAKIAFIEDRDILVEVHKGMKNKRTRNINLGIDAGSMRFRKMIEKQIAEATGAA
jgi:vanillate O-demethylase monooxygenase subunit